MRHMNNTDLWQKATAFAARAHRHQLRKDGQTPYVSHCMRVALTISQVFGCDDPAIVVAGLLHDTLEDTTTDYDDLEQYFGTEVADIVAAMSKDMRLAQEMREQAYDRQLAAGPWQARMVKLADVYDNLTDAAGEKKCDYLDKAARILAMTEGDAQLARADAALRELVASTGAQTIASR